MNIDELNSLQGDKRKIALVDYHNEINEQRAKDKMDSLRWKKRDWATKNRNRLLKMLQMVF